MHLKLFPYFMKLAIINIVNNRGVHLLSLIISVSALIIYGAFLLLFVNIEHWVHGLGDSMTMSVYLKDDNDLKLKDKIAFLIRSVPGVEVKNYVSSDSALKEFRKTLGSQYRLLDGLPFNPLPASFEIEIINGENRQDLDAIKKQLEQINGVEEVQYSEAWLRNFEGTLELIRIIGFILGGLISLGVLFIVTNTIKLTFISRKEEIEILKLVGATNFFVKVPFIIEGVILGFLSGCISLIALYTGYSYILSKKAQFVGYSVVDIIFIPPDFSLLIIFMSVGLGIISSFIAIGRFIDV